MAFRVTDWQSRFEKNRTRELKRLDWIPVPNSIDDLDYIRLVTHSNGAAHLGAWLVILQIASRQKERGTLPQDGAGLSQSLAAISRFPAALFDEVLPRLRELKWIEQFGEIPQDAAEIPQDAAEKCALQDRVGKGIEGNGTENPIAPSGAGESVVRSALSAKVKTTTEDFDRFWFVWWNKTAKEAARKAWPSVAARFGAEFLISEVSADRARWESREEWAWRSRLHPATWLHGKRWEDQLPPDVRVAMKAYRPDMPPSIPVHTADEERNALKHIAEHDADPSAREFARRKLATA